MEVQNITDYWLSSPLSALLSAVISFSIALVSDRIGCFVFKNKSGLHRALYFFAGLLALSWIVLLLSLMGIVSVLILQIGAAMLFVAALAISVRKGRPRALPFFQEFRGTWRRLPPMQKVFSVLVIAVLFMYAGIALAPPTDADSLDYHLGAPLQILQQHSIWLNKDYLHFRMLSFGELINMLGISIGCVQLGAFLQLIALYWMSVGLSEISGSRKTLSWALILSAPLLLTLIPSQKQQLTGVACTSLCFYFVFGRGRQIAIRDYALLILCLLFAAGLKYNFIVSTAVIFVYMILRGVPVFRPSYLAILLVGFSICLAPLLLYKFNHFGDALSPMLEGFKQHPDPAILRFRNFIKRYTDSHYHFPLGLLVPYSLSDISTVLGYSVFAAMAILFLFRNYKAEIMTMLLFVLLVIFIGQKTARFFLEPFYWSMPVLLVTACSRRWLAVVLKGSLLQFFALIPFVVFSFCSLTPGIISDARRSKLMSRSAAFFEEAQWMKRLLPPNAVICTDVRSRALLSFKSFPIEYIYFTSFRDSAQVRQFEYLLYDKYKVTYLVLSDIGSSGVVLRKYGGKRIAGPVTFSMATRNPFNRQRYNAYIYEIRSAAQR